MKWRSYRRNKLEDGNTYFDTYFVKQAFRKNLGNSLGENIVRFIQHEGLAERSFKIKYNYYYFLFDKDLGQELLRHNNLPISDLFVRFEDAVKAIYQYERESLLLDKKAFKSSLKLNRFGEVFVKIVVRGVASYQMS